MNAAYRGQMRKDSAECSRLAGMHYTGRLVPPLAPHMNYTGPGGGGGGARSFTRAPYRFTKDVC